MVKRIIIDCVLYRNEKVIQADYFGFNGLRRKCEEDNLQFDYYILPLRENHKLPARNGLLWKTEREFAQIPFEDVEKAIRKSNCNIGFVATHFMDGDTQNKNHVSLSFIDIDLDESGKPKLPPEKIQELIEHFDTLTVRTRSGGYHLYIATKSDLVLSIEEECGTKNPHPCYNGVDFGELRMATQYVAGVGSYIPPDAEGEKPVNNPEADGFYSITRDRPIRLIDRRDIPEWITFDNGNSKTSNNSGGCSYAQRINYNATQKDIDEISSLSSTDPNDFTNSKGISLAEIRNQDITLDHALMGAKESDRSKMDYAIAYKLKKYGFSYAQVFVILRKLRPYSKTQSDYHNHLTIGKVFGSRSDSIVNHNKHNINTVNASDELPCNSESSYFEDDGISIVNVEDFPDELPDTKCAILEGLPRTGKSYYSLQQLGKYNSGIYVAPNYEILEKQFRNFHKIYPDKKAAIIYGKNKACNNGDGNCKNCPLMPVFNKTQMCERLEADPDNHNKLITFMEIEDRARSFCNNNSKIEISKIPEVFCRYYFLHMCERFVDYVFTIPYYTNVEDERGILTLTKREFMVLDEDTTFRYFRSKEVLIAIHIASKSGASIKNKLSDFLALCKKPDDEKKKTEDIIYRSIHDYLRQISTLLDDFGISIKNVNDENAPGFESVYNKIIGIKPICNIDGEDVLLSQLDDDLKRRTLKYCIEEYFSTNTIDDVGILDVFIAILYPLEINPIACLNKTSIKELYLIPEAYEYSQLPVCADKFLCIGFTEAEIFAKKLVDNNLSDITKIRINKFDYAKNYVVIKAMGDTSGAQKEVIFKIIGKLLNYNKNKSWVCPFMVLASSKKNQETINEKYNDENLTPVDVQGVKKIYGRCLIGESIIFYQNSIISRGLDIPFIDIMIVYKCEFFLPYYQAIIVGYKRQLDGDGLTSDEINDINDKINDTYAIINDIYADEATNSMLRITPVKGKREEQSKFIILKDSDLKYLKFDARTGMKIVELSEGNIDDVVDFITSYSSKVNPEIVMVKGTEEKSLEMVDFITEEDIERFKYIDAIEFGRSFTEIPANINSMFEDRRIRIGMEAILKFAPFFERLKYENISKSYRKEPLVNELGKQKKSVNWDKYIIDKLISTIICEKFFSYIKEENKKEDLDDPYGTYKFFIDYDNMMDINKFESSDYYDLYVKFYDKCISKDSFNYHPAKSSQGTLSVEV